MQVYREIPVISNQSRERPAELIAVTSVAENWNVARHAKAAEGILRRDESAPFVLDAGTGMYLNAILMDVELAPRVSPELRNRAQEMVEEIEYPGINPRRAVREIELNLADAPRRGSIWDDRLRFDVNIVYLRPQKEVLADAIERRTRRILDLGIEEVAKLRESSQKGFEVTHQVRRAIGFQEINQALDGSSSLHEAGERISQRTRTLAKRQIQWFDKLADKLSTQAEVRVIHEPVSNNIKNYMRDIVGA
jgi:tRNA dimethylallyltransferase